MTEQEWILEHYKGIKDREKPYFGQLILTFEAGNVTTIKKGETIKRPKNLNN